jgi:protease PrsW
MAAPTPPPYFPTSGDDPTRPPPGLLAASAGPAPAPGPALATSPEALPAAAPLPAMAPPAAVATWPAAAPTGRVGSPDPAGSPAPTRRRRGRSVLGLGLFIAFIAASGLAVLTYVGSHIGPVALGVGIAAAILPVPVLVGCFLWLDRYQPTPMRYLMLCFGWGACVATGGALLVNNAGANLAENLGLTDGYVGVFVAPLVEETMKAAFPILLFIFRRRLFEGILDGIILCGLSATGFAMVENILYLGGLGYGASVKQTGSVASGALAVEAIFIVRVLMSGFAHPLFTSMTGLGLGIASRAPVRGARIAIPLAGLLTAMMLHGSWNLMATIAVANIFTILYGYFAFFVPIFFGMVGLVLWLRSREGRLTERILPQYVNLGWFSPPEVAALGTLGRRLSARRWAKRVAGDAGLTAMRGYQYAASQLALLRDAMNRGMRTPAAELAKAVEQERQLLAAIDGYRRAFAARDPVTPPAYWDGRGYTVRFPDGVSRQLPPPDLPVVPVPYVVTGVAPPVPPPWSANPDLAR